MRYCYAKSLRNGDEIEVKATGEICRVISTEKMRDPDGDEGILIYVQTNQDGYVGLHHQEVK
jgi:hypothetical protein